jgi:hypothetical protein
MLGAVQSELERDERAVRVAEYIHLGGREPLDDLVCEIGVPLEL